MVGKYYLTIVKFKIFIVYHLLRSEEKLLYISINYVTYSVSQMVHI